MELSKEQYEKLSIYEKQLVMAYKGRYLAGVGPKKIELFIDVYNELFNKHETYSTASCSKCLFNIVYRLGELYFKYQEQHADDPVEEVEEPKEIEVTTIDGEVGTIANSVERTDADGNKYNLKSIEEDKGQNLRKVKNSKNKESKKCKE